MRALRVDKSQAEIVNALRKLGASVEVIRSPKAGCPDLVVGFRGVNYLVECKTPKTGRLSQAQKDWRDSWRGGKPFVLKTTDEAISFIDLLNFTTVRYRWEKSDEIHQHVPTARTYR